MCIFCPNNIASLDMGLPTPHQDTCTTNMYNYALDLAADNPKCNYAKGTKFLCCPTLSVVPAIMTDVLKGTMNSGAGCPCSPVVYNIL